MLMLCLQDECHSEKSEEKRNQISFNSCRNKCIVRGISHRHCNFFLYMHSSSSCSPLSRLLWKMFFFQHPTSAHLHTSTSSCCFCFWSSPWCIIFLFWGHGPITLAEMKGPSRAPSKGCTHGSSHCLLCGANKHTWRPSGAIRQTGESERGAWLWVGEHILCWASFITTWWVKLSKIRQNEWLVGKEEQLIWMLHDLDPFFNKKDGLSNGKPLATGPVAQRDSLSAGLTYYLFISPNSWHLLIIVQ